MIVAMQEGADERLIQQVIEHLVKMGFEVHRSTGARMTVLGAVGSGIDFDIRILELLPGVQEVHRISSPYKLAGRSFRPEGTIVHLANGIGIGGNEVVVMVAASGRPPPRVFETLKISGITPNISDAVRCPMRPKAVCASSKINNMPRASAALRNACM